ncbi:beta-ketoacyl synthase N-terminal-like domain-containing protein [Streptomyces lasiicapitis]|uniref:beta-ketoacyl synthase N-terminal-like domain-containing protein n=1 Tax=Streptomyces lasiicapitis TaxID=1923961 RepID=UPI0035716D1B
MNTVRARRHARAHYRRHRMACQLPGAPSPEALWRLLRAGDSSVRPTPADRLRASATPMPRARTTPRARTRTPRRARASAFRALKRRAAGVGSSTRPSASTPDSSGSPLRRRTSSTPRSHPRRLRHAAPPARRRARHTPELHRRAPRPHRQPAVRRDLARRALL